MRLKMFIWHNQTTQKPEKVYEFPWSEAHACEIAIMGRCMFTKKPLERPIMSLSPDELTEIKEQRFTATWDMIKRSQETSQQQQM